MNERFDKIKLWIHLAFVAITIFGFMMLVMACFGSKTDDPALKLFAKIVSTIGLSLGIIRSLLDVSAIISNKGLIGIVLAVSGFLVLGFLIWRADKMVFQFSVYLLVFSILLLLPGLFLEARGTYSRFD